MLKRILVAGGVLAGLSLVAAAGFAWYMIARVTAQPHPVPARAAPQADGRAVALGQPPQGGLKVHVLQTGETVVPWGQFWSGLDGWVGVGAVWRQGLAADPAWVPVHVFLVEHPVAGRVLVDAGLSAAQNVPGYYSFGAGGVTAGIWRDSHNRLPDDQRLVTQLAGLGIRPADIAHVVLTHLHEDHVGELRAFPQAVVHVSQAEWDDRARLAYPPSLAPVTRWDVFEFDSGRLDPFEATRDLFGDGSIILLPTFGHTLGHTSVLVHLGDHQVLLPGDSLYTLRHLDPDAIAAFNYFGPRGFETQIDSIRRMRGLQDRLPGLVIAPPHDPFAYSIEYLRPALADGVLSPEERAGMRRYQASLYDGGRLRGTARPRYVPPADGEAAGRMASDIR